MKSWQQRWGWAIAIASVGSLVFLWQDTASSRFLSLLRVRSNRPAQTQAQVQAQALQATDTGITYETVSHPRSVVHVVRIPAQAPVTITPFVVASLEKVERLAQQQGALVAINGGFFDPNNEQTTSYVSIDGEIALDPKLNAGLMENPNVVHYLSRILNRSEFRRYRCLTSNGEHNQYAIATHSQLNPLSCRLVDALGAGPALIPQFRGEAEAFTDADSGRDVLGSRLPNARSAIGITSDGTVVLVMAAQRAEISDRSGLSLFELADVMESLGVTQGLNLDGGSSSSLFHNGTMHYGRLDTEGNPIQRSVKSILLVMPTDN